MTARVRESQLPLLRQRLKECGCDNVNQLVKEVLNRNVDKITEDEKKNRMPQTNQSSTGFEYLLYLPPDAYRAECKRLDERIREMRGL